jgi:hypothetical protein
MRSGIRPQRIEHGIEVLKGQALRILPSFLPKALERVIPISEGHVDAGTCTTWLRDSPQHLEHLLTTPSSRVHPSTIAEQVVLGLAVEGECRVAVSDRDIVHFL